jgi:hypothetical protein
MSSKFWILGLVVILLTNCSVSTDNFPSPAELKTEIAKSILVPFETGDTLVYKSPNGICGNSSIDEVNRHYEPYLNEPPYLDILRKRYTGTVLVTGDSLYNALMTSFEKVKLPASRHGIAFQKAKFNSHYWDLL